MSNDTHIRLAVRPQYAAALEQIGYDLDDDQAEATHVLLALVPGRDEREYGAKLAEVGRDLARDLERGDLAGAQQRMASLSDWVTSRAERLETTAALIRWFVEGLSGGGWQRLEDALDELRALGRQAYAAQMELADARMGAA